MSNKGVFKCVLCIATDEPDGNGCILTKKFLRSSEFKTELSKLDGCMVDRDYSGLPVGSVRRTWISGNKAMAEIELNEDITNLASAVPLYSGPTLYIDDDTKEVNGIQSRGLSLFNHHVDPDVPPIKRIDNKDELL